MPVARSEIVDLSVTRYYYCISECVRQTPLCGPGWEHRKRWLESRIQTLATNFAISVCGFSVLDQEIRAVVRLEPEQADAWSASQVVRRWIQVSPPPGVDLDDHQAVEKYVESTARDSDTVARYRERLKNLGWFMKELKEPLSRMANKEDGCYGAFWASRYKSIAILDDEALLSALVLVDATVPVRDPDGVSPHDPASATAHTSARVRRGTTIEGSDRVLELRELDQQLWLCPVEDRSPVDAVRKGMFAKLPVSSYLGIVDFTFSLVRTGRSGSEKLVGGACDVLQRIGSTLDRWSDRMIRLARAKRLIGNYFATDGRRLREVARLKQRRFLQNLSGCPA